MTACAAKAWSPVRVSVGLTRAEVESSRLGPYRKPIDTTMRSIAAAATAVRMSTPWKPAKTFYGFLLKEPSRRASRALSNCSSRPAALQAGGGPSEHTLRTA